MHIVTALSNNESHLLCNSFNPCSFANALQNLNLQSQDIITTTLSTFHLLCNQDILIAKLKPLIDGLCSFATTYIGSIAHGWHGTYADPLG
jgi:hypothetical protein